MVLTFGQRLRRERKRLNLSADYIAEKLGLSRTTQFLYETDKTKASVDYLLKAGSMGLDVNYLLYGDQPIAQEQVLSIAPGLLPEIFRMIEFFCQDAQGNALEPEVKSALFSEICELIENQPRITEDHVNWRQEVFTKFQEIVS
jgi:transcriptional regulator with XRE-family HTH domain